MKRVITAFLLTGTLMASSVSTASAEVVNFQCTGGTYSVEMPAASITKDNGCTGNLVIDPSIKSIGDRAFVSSKITSITIPNTVTSIGNSAFSSSALNSVIIPNSVTSIASSAFQSSQIRSVVISNALTTISDSALAIQKILPL